MFETSEYNITYLLGAGASAKALPTVKKTKISKDMPSQFEMVADQLFNLEFDRKYLPYVESLKVNLDWLSQNTTKYSTPDTFAKYLFLKQRGELLRLKNTLTAFFLIEQIVNGKIDDRALIFLINVMQTTIFPGNINILSWNYDFQIQLAAENFREERFNYDGKGSIHSPPLIGYYPELGYGHFVDSKDISMVHLNGIAGSYYHYEHGISKSFFERREERTLNNIFEFLSDENHDRGSSLTFAWENSNFSEKLKLAKEIASKTDILVVIGYSFPFFNRKIDKEVFESFKEGGRLKTIYHQDPFYSGEFLRNQFQLDEKVLIHDVKEVESYFIPLEL